MTENEKLNEALEDFEALCNGKALCVTGEALNMVISAVKKSQAYETIGTIEEFKAFKLGRLGNKGFISIGQTMEEYAQEIRAKAIDEFLHNAEVKIYDKILQNQARLEFASGLSVANRMLDEIAEMLKGGAK